MPIAFRCAGCTQVLKVPDSMAGSKGKCPKCGSVLLVPGKNVAAQPAAAPATARKRPVEAAVSREQTMRPRQRPAPVADDGGDDGEEAAPRSSEVRKKKKKKSSPILLFGLAGGGCFLLLFGCSGLGALAWWLWPSGISDDLKFMPDNCMMVASLRVEELMKSDVYKEIQREVPEVEKQTAGMNKELGLGPSDIDQMVIGIGSSADHPIIVVRTKKDVKAADLRSQIKNGNYTETKVGKYLMQEPSNDINPAFCVVDSKRIVIGDKGPLRTVLTRDKKPEMTKNLQEAMKQVDFSKTIAVAVDTKSGLAKSGGNLGMLGGGQEMLSSFEKTTAIAFQAKVSSDIKLDLTLLCQDAASANDIKKLIDGFLVMGRNNSKDIPKEVSDLLDIQLKVDGTKVVANKTVKVSPLIKLGKQTMGGGVPNQRRVPGRR